MSTQVAFIGLEVMGFPMASHLVQAGHKVTVYNRTTSVAKDWLKQHQQAENRPNMATTPEQAARNSSIVFTCVGNDDDLRSVVLGSNGAFSGMTAHTLLVDHTTTSATVARELFNIAKNKKLNFIDAPVSGGRWDTSSLLKRLRNTKPEL